jgi:hypothetical protein
VYVVVGVQGDLRYSLLDWKDDDASVEPPSEVQFVEYEDVTLDKPWGYWVLGDGTEVICQDTSEARPGDDTFISVNRYLASFFAVTRCH